MSILLGIHASWVYPLRCSQKSPSNERATLITLEYLTDQISIMQALP